MTMPFECTNCHKDTDIDIVIESPSDYYPDCHCEHCGFDMYDNDKLQSRIMEFVGEYFVARAEWARDRMKDASII